MWPHMGIEDERALHLAIVAGVTWDWRIPTQWIYQYGESLVRAGGVYSAVERVCDNNMKLISIAIDKYQSNQLTKIKRSLRDDELRLVSYCPTKGYPPKYLPTRKVKKSSRNIQFYKNSIGSK